MSSNSDGNLKNNPCGPFICRGWWSHLDGFQYALSHRHRWPIWGFPSVEAPWREADCEWRWRCRITADLRCREKAHLFSRECWSRENETLWNFVMASQGKLWHWLGYRLWNWIIWSGMLRLFQRLSSVPKFRRTEVEALSVLALPRLTRLKPSFLLLAGFLFASPHTSRGYLLYWSSHRIPGPFS